jgi:serine-type D-Ala-D-Ala carboxypeptidase (penicillin-binding protein 5/6)
MSRRRRRRAARLAPRSPLGPPARRRRPVQTIATLALLLAPLAVAAAVYLAFAPSDNGGGGAAGLPIAVHTPPHPVRGASAAQPEHVEPPPGVDLAGVDAFHLALRKPPRAGLVFDLDDGEVLWRRDPLRVVSIASLTKIMTALVVVERTRPAERVKITQAALNYTGSGIGLLPKGRRVRLEALLNGLLLVSGNDAAIALAARVSGSERRFVALMNRHARRWGLRCTHFASSHGLEDGNRSCARDLAVLTRLAMTKPRIRRIARRPSATLRFPIKGHKLYLYGHNPLIRMGYAGAIGLKTGYTEAAGRCFVGVVRRGGRRLGVVLLNSRDPAKQAPKLLDAAFSVSSHS